MPKVSAIVSAYYAPDYIEGRLVNLTLQNPMPEIIVIAKVGSKELECAKEFELDFLSHGIFRIMPTLNVPTIYAAWNMAIAVAKGEYLTNANCDDRLHDGALDRMANILDNNPDIGVVFSAVDMTVEGGESHFWKRIEDDTGVMLDPFQRLMGQYFVGAMPVWRKSLGYYDPDLRHAGDLEFFLRVALEGAGFYYIDEALGIYDKRANSDEHRNKAASLYEHDKILTDYLYKYKAGVPA